MTRESASQRALRKAIEALLKRPIDLKLLSLDELLKLHSALCAARGAANRRKP